jgi:hypothetical protein
MAAGKASVGEFASLDRVVKKIGDIHPSIGVHYLHWHGHFTHFGSKVFPLKCFEML